MSSSPGNCAEFYNNPAIHDATYGIQNLSVSGRSNAYSPYGHLPPQPKSRAMTDALFVLRSATKGPIQVYSNDFFTGK